MIKSIQFKNFKVLRDCTLPLSQFTLLIGPNGSGKSTALRGLEILRTPDTFKESFQSIAARDEQQDVELLSNWGGKEDGAILGHRWSISRDRSSMKRDSVRQGNMPLLIRILERTRVFSLDPQAVPRPVQLVPRMVLEPGGAGLAGVLDRIRDESPERFESLNEEMGRWIPEFDRVLFETPAQGFRGFRLRLRGSDVGIPAEDVSQGTLLALALLTIAHLPDPPSILALEEPDRGLHPRLLRDVRDAMYRLAYPEQHGDSREPVQVIATTHSPYLLDQFKDHPDEVVIANRVEANVTFERLSDRPDLDEILKDSVLGDAWYSGILGGVPAQP